VQLLKNKMKKWLAVFCGFIGILVLLRCENEKVNLRSDSMDGSQPMANIQKGATDEVAFIPKDTSKTNLTGQTCELTCSCDPCQEYESYEESAMAGHGAPFCKTCRGNPLAYKATAKAQGRCELRGGWTFYPEKCDCAPVCPPPNSRYSCIIDDCGQCQCGLTIFPTNITCPPDN
jgi:hypothetical protein